VLWWWVGTAFTSHRECVYSITAREHQSATAAPYYDNSLGTAIGNNHWAPGDGQWATFNGIIDELRVYDRALSPDEITEHYNNPCGQVAAEPVRWSAIKAMHR
jgi:hypothetical protein